jgi:hypothetical protein
MTGLPLVDAKRWKRYYRTKATIDQRRYSTMPLINKKMW